jgi:hypothetical protein
MRRRSFDMMDGYGYGWMGVGGAGSVGAQVLLLIVIVGLVVWIIKKNKK